MRSPRRYVSPRGVILFVLLVVLIVLGVTKIQATQHGLNSTQRDLAEAQRQIVGTQRDFRSAALAGCRRSNVQNTALLDLGKIITSARAQTSTSPKVRAAGRDFVLQVRRLDVNSPEGRALADLGILVAGDSGEPVDPRKIAALEDDFIRNSKKIEQPRDCDKAYG